MSQYHINPNYINEEGTAHGEELPSRKKVLVKKGEIPHITQIATSRSWDECDTGKNDPHHHHPTMWEIYHIVSGRARFTVGEEEFIVEAGDFVKVPPQTVHRYVVLEGEELRLFYFGVAMD